MPTRVLIIGGGVAGLTLAHGLKKAGIAVHVFERNANLDICARPFAMRVTQDGKIALRSVLSEELYDQLVQSSAEVGRESLTTEGPASVLPAVDRTVLRKLLLTNLKGNLSFGKELINYTIAAGGDVTVHFKDGSEETGSVLIGADGWNSAVRSQYLPHRNLLDTDGRLIWGKTQMSPQLRERLSTDLENGVPDHINNGSTTLIVLPIIFDKSDSHVPKDYAYWILCANKSDTKLSTENFNSLTHHEAADVALELIKVFNAPNDIAKLKLSVVELQDRSQTIPHVLASADPEWYTKSWEPSVVTLIGDAIHPLGMGAGGGAALKDVQTLLRLFQEEGISTGSIGKYENIMKEHVKPLLAMAFGKGKVLFGQPPAEQSLALSL